MKPIKFFGMKILIGFPGWGWKMYGIARFYPKYSWFIGFSKQAPENWN